MVGKRMHEVLKRFDDFDDNQTALAQSMVELNTVYEFRLVTTATLSSNGSGILAGYQNADPSGGSGSTWTASEWSALVSLFSEVRMKSFSIRFSSPYPRDPDFNTNTGNFIVLSGVLSSVASAPTTAAQVWDNADARPFNLQHTQRDVILHTIKGTDLNWAIVTTPNPGSYAGVPGSIQWYGSTYPASTTCGVIFIEGIYQFRSRI
jgi:hypothetical protein